MFGGAFGGGSQQPAQPAQPAMGGQAQMDPNAQMMAAEQEMEMVTTMFEHLNDLCYKKCLIQRYSDEELTKAESVCIDRCAAKYFQVNREVSDKLAKMTQANSL